MTGTSFEKVVTRLSSGRVLGLVVVALAVGIAGCGSSSKSSSSSSGSSSSSSASAKPPSKTIGYVDILSAGAQQKRWFSYFKAGADVLGWKVIDKSANGVGTAGLQAVQNFVQQGVDAIVVSCIDTPVLRPGLVAARNAKIPVIAVGCQNGPPDNAWDATYAENDKALAEKLSTYVVAQLKKAPVQKASVLQDRTILVGRLRSDFFINALKKANINIVSTPVIPETSIEPSTTQAIKATMQATPDNQAFIPVFDFSSGPSVAALKSLGLDKKVSVYTYYADEVNLPLLLQPGSPLKAVVDGPVEQVSLVTLDQLLRHFVKGTKIDPNAANNLKVDYVIFTKANAPAFHKGYITPFPVGKYLAPFVQRWNTDLGYKLPVPSGG